MAAPKNNVFYKFVQKPSGRPRKYTPNTLWQKGLEYFDWATNNPLYEQKAFANGRVKAVPKMRALSEFAFCLFANIDQETFRKYKNGKPPYEDFVGVGNKISGIIYCQKFEGACADLLNPNLIARDLGLADRTKAEFENISDSDLDAIISRLTKIAEEQQKNK